MSVLAKLIDAAEQCDSALIVMTGDDLDADCQAHARENVIHEVGYFPGKYGPSRVVLLHEEGVNIPSNIHGLVYTPLPGGVIEATFGWLLRSLARCTGANPPNASAVLPTRPVVAVDAPTVWLQQ